MVSQSIRVQVLVLTFILDLFQDFRRCAYSGRRRFRRRRGDYDDFVNSKMICRLSLSEVLIGVVCARVYECLHVYCVEKKVFPYLNHLNTEHFYQNMETAPASCD